MTFYDIQIKYVNENDRTTSYESSDFVRLEEIEWESPSDSGFYDWYTETYGEESDWSNMLEALNEYHSYDCIDGYFEAQIKAYKSRDDLNYTIKASRGEWATSEPEVVEEQVIDTLDIEGVSSYDVDDVYIKSIVCASWDGDVLDSNGALLTTNPEIKAVYQDIEDENNYTIKLDFGQTVTGTISLIYYTTYDLWTLQVEAADETSDSSVDASAITIGTTLDEDGVVLSSEGASGATCNSYYDEDDISSAYSSTVTATWTGGQDSLSITTPDDLQDNCDPIYTRTDVDPDDDEEEVSKYNVMVSEIFDYCTGNPIEDYTVYINGVLVTGNYVILESGTHTIKVIADGYTDSDLDDLTENDTFTLP